LVLVIHQIENSFGGEMVNKQLVLLFSMLVVLTLVLASCGGSTPEEEEVQEPAEQAQEQVQEEAAPAEAEEAIAEDPLGNIVVAPGDPLRIASSLVIAGPNETLGIDSQRGVEIAIDDRGQVAGHEVELVAEDDGCSAEGGQTSATKTASDDRIVAVVGHSCSSSCTPAAPIYNDAGLTMISPSCTAPALTGQGTHVDSLLRTAHNDNVQGRIMAEFVYNELGLRKAATIHDGSPYAEQLQQVFADVFVELGGEITAQEAVNVGDTDMRPVLTSIATGEPEIIYYPIFVSEGAFVTNQAKEISGLENVALAGADGMISSDFLSAAGDAAEGMYISGPDLTFTGGRYEAFLAKHQEKYGEPPTSAFHAHAYDATNMVFDAVEQVATTDAEGNTVIGRQALRDALYATSNFDGITGNLNCNELGDCADPKIAVNQIQGGAYTPIYQGGEALGEAAMADEGESMDAMAPEGPFTIGMMQIATHPALDAGRDGAIQGLADNGLIEGENITVVIQNAEGDIATLSTIAQSFVDDEVDMIISTSTPASQAAFKAVQDLESPYVVFNVVTDPFAAGLATAPDDHLAWIVGTQAMPPVEDAMSTMLEIAPEVETVGIIWNPSEKNSEVATGIAREVAQDLGVALIEANITDSSEIQTAAESLIAQDIDAFFISTDSTVVAGFEALVKVANENEIPLFANDPASAVRGAVAAVGVDYFQDGYDSGVMAAKILLGEAMPSDFTIEPQSASILHINYDAASAQGVEFSEEIEERAVATFGGE
jgi:branched-chain amino acid transport system substrate-binding protein